MSRARVETKPVLSEQGTVVWREFEQDDNVPVFGDDEEEPVALAVPAIPDDYEGRDMVPLSQVMPYGRTVSDRCDRCFQIPASNGLCCQ